MYAATPSSPRRSARAIRSAGESAATLRRVSRLEAAATLLGPSNDRMRADDPGDRLQSQSMELHRRESAAVWLLSIPIWGMMLVLLWAHQFEVLAALKSPFFWALIAAEICWRRFAGRDLRRWSANPTHENTRRQQR
jgi:hypothetical protein